LGSFLFEVNLKEVPRFTGNFPRAAQGSINFHKSANFLIFEYNERQKTRYLDAVRLKESRPALIGTGATRESRRNSENTPAPPLDRVPSGPPFPASASSQWVPRSSDYLLALYAEWEITSHALIGIFKSYHEIVGRWRKNYLTN
jgi:hypothetical protein